MKHSALWCQNLGIMFGLVSIEDKRWLQDVIELTWLTYYLKVQFESSVHLNLSLSLIWGCRIDLFLPLQVCAAVCIFSQVPIYCLRHKNCQASTLWLLTLTFTQLIFSLFMMHGRLYYKWEQITDSHLPNRKLICFFLRNREKCDDVLVHVHVSYPPQTQALGLDAF